MGISKKCPVCGIGFIGKGKYCGGSWCMGKVRESVDQLKAKEGPIYEKWKRKLKEALKRV